jgi:hypothetical protein
VGDCASFELVCFGYQVHMHRIFRRGAELGGTFGWGVDPFGECRFLLVDVSLGDNVLSRLALLD